MVDGACGAVDSASTARMASTKALAAAVILRAAARASARRRSPRSTPLDQIGGGGGGGRRAVDFVCAAAVGGSGAVVSAIGGAASGNADEDLAVTWRTAAMAALASGVRGVVSVAAPGNRLRRPWYVGVSDVGGSRFGGTSGSRVRISAASGGVQ